MFTNVLKDLESCFEETNMPNWKDQFYLSKVARAICKLSTTGLTD